jgi:hypothetical protein
MGNDDHTDASRNIEPFPGRSVTAMIDQLEAAKRELEVAEAARKARADEVTRIADTVDASMGQAIHEATAERDELERRLQDVKQQLRDLESARSTARMERFTTSIGSTTTASSDGVTDPPEAGGALDRDEGRGDADRPGTPTPGDDDGYEDSWYEVLRQQAEAEEADGRENR